MPKQCNFNKGDIVKIDKDELNKDNVGKYCAIADDDFSNFINSGMTHKVTNTYIKNPYSDDVIYRIELDKEFMFYENELIKISESNESMRGVIKVYKCKNNNDCDNDNLCCFSCDNITECRAKSWLCDNFTENETPDECPYIDEK